jgi:2-methylcitrate dehydratase
MKSLRFLRRDFLKTFGVGAMALTSHGWAPRFLQSLHAQTTAPQETETRSHGEERSRTAVAEDVGAWVEKLRYEDLPPQIVAKTKRVLLDTVGCALGAVDAAPVRFAQQTIFFQGGNPQATLLGLGRKVSCDQAAFLNGMAIRYLDYNDYAALGDPNHCSINVAPALAVAEMRGLTGKDLLLGITVGYEVQLRLRDAITGGPLVRGWDVGTITTNYASAATAAKLLGLNALQIANAMAIAGAHGNTLGEVRGGALLSGGEMTPSKGTADPMSARAGTFAALLAQQGLSYPVTILEGVYGFGKKVTGALREDLLRQRTGDFQILKSCTKMWPCFMYGQAPIAAALEIHKRNVNTAEIQSITVPLSEYAYENQQDFKGEITAREHADHSIPYVVARALLDGDVKADDFEPNRFREPRAIELLRKVTLRPEPSLTSANREAAGAYIEVTLRNGTVLRAEVPHPPGSMQNPPTDPMLSRKFLNLSEPVLGRARAEKAIEVILRADSLASLRELVEAVSSPARSGRASG